MATAKKSTTYRLSDKARQLLTQLAEFHGVSHTAVLEMVIRQAARQTLDGPGVTGRKGPKGRGK
jgi:hypothetical protein